MKVALFVIDPQIDFCDPQGALYVPGAEDDIKRLAKMVDAMGNKISNIYVTMDAHHRLDIGHPNFYLNGELNHPNPFTVVSEDDVKNGVWRAAIPGYQKWLEQYVKALNTNKRYPLMVWPEHCLIGSNGFTIHPTLFEAFKKWENIPSNFIQYCTKGSNPLTEHYSIFMADVPDPNDPSTQFNANFAKAIASNDVILIAGEARTHCVLNSVKDLVENMPVEFVKKLVLLNNAMSNIPGFEQTADAFFTDLVSKGMKVSSTADWM